MDQARMVRFLTIVNFKKRRFLVKMEPVEVGDIETVQFNETDGIETIDMNFSGQSMTTVCTSNQGQPTQPSKKFVFSSDFIT